MVRVTRRYRFSASHRLHSQALSAADNRRVYGKCNNPFGHGHDYVLEVSVRGPVAESTGLAADVRGLDALIGERVLRFLDHRDLSADVPEFGAAVPTTENLAAVVERRLAEAWPAAWPRLECIRIRETKRNTIELKAAAETQSGA